LQHPPADTRERGQVVVAEGDELPSKTPCIGSRANSGSSSVIGQPRRLRTA
jgi:hypothetical protein